MEVEHGGLGLGAWMKAYWTWLLSGTGDAKLQDRAFLPMPQGVDNGSGVWVGQADAALETADGFVLPLLAWTGETYNNGTPDDDPNVAPLHDEFVATTLLVTLDGLPIIDGANGLDPFYYPAETFDSPIMYPAPSSYGSTGAIWVKGLGFLHTPLAIGAHTLHLAETNVGLNQAYDNTWNISVGGVEAAHGGVSLGGYMKAYFGWAIGGAAETRLGDRMFLPTPQGTDNGSGVLVGTQDVTLAAADGFVLPLFVWIGESYNNGTADDDPAAPPLRDAFLATQLHVTLDGVTIVDDTLGLGEYWFDAETFDTPLTYPAPTSYGSIAAIWVKGMGFLHAPLATGTHTLHLVETNTGLGVAWDNTWNLTVSP